MNLKILYGVNTNGQGHINRARTIIRQLEVDGHKVTGLFSGPKPPKYALSLFKNYKVFPGHEMVFKGRSVDVPRTVFLSVNHLLYLPTNLKLLVEHINKHEYDLIISDFEILSSIAGKFSNVPVIPIDHQHSFLHEDAVYPPGRLMDRVNLQIAIYAAVPYCDHFIALDYVKNIYSNENGTLHPLIYKTDFDKYEVSVNNHYTVYLYAISPRQIINVFKMFPDENFKVYGFNRNLKIGNITFKPTSREEFLKDLTSGKGIISQSGFSLTWEAALLQKPLYTIPQENQYEQYSNAYRIEKQKFGYAQPNLTFDYLQEFINFCQDHDFQVRNQLPVVSMPDFTELIYKIKDNIK